MNEGTGISAHMEGLVLDRSKGSSAIPEEMRGEPPDTDARIFVAVCRCSWMYTPMVSARRTRLPAESEHGEDAEGGGGRSR